MERGGQEEPEEISETDDEGGGESSEVFSDINERE